MTNDQQNPFNYLFYMLSVFVAGSLLFLIGFFPISTNIIEEDGQQHYDSVQPKKLDEYILQPPLPKYDQTIFMIIDAWRFDYSNATNMPFAYEHACDHLQIKVDIPTVTMPRLKSMTTGTISNFIDIVLNLGHTSKLNDSILHQLNEKNKRSVFAGDRTWIQLFPNEFLRKTVNKDSFFVNDFYEGDLNVTKSLKEELRMSDWHLLVLHYLGLDHIGHVEGSHSEKIYKKLLEMDNIIKYIVTHQRFKNSLLLLTGDHGMRNGGSHGGSDKEELYVPLMGFHKNCDKHKRSNSEYNQVDITATLAMLFDARIPHTSIGCLIPELLEDYSRQDQLYFYYYNALHLMEKWKARFSLIDVHSEDFFSWYRDAQLSHKEFISSEAKSSLSFEKAKQNYIRLSTSISQLLSESLIRYDNPLIAIALSLTTLCALKLILNVLSGSVPNSLEINWCFWKTLLICFSIACCLNFVAHFFDILKIQGFGKFILLTFPLALSIYFIIDVSKLVFFLTISRAKLNVKLSIPFVLLSLFLCHTVSLASSSFIEEEHQTWYYFTPSLLVFLTLQNFYNDVKSVWQKQKSVKILVSEFWKMRFVFILMVSIILCRRLNQTGDKWRHLVDIGDILAKSDNYTYLTLTHLTGVVTLFLLLKKYNSSLGMFFCFVALFCVCLYRQGKQDSIVLMIFWASIIGRTVVSYRDICSKHKNYGYEIKGNLVELLKTNMTCCFLISALLHKPHNVILLPTLLYTLEISYYLCDNLHLKDKRVYNRCYVLVLKTVITIFIANMFYFFQGNSNSLTTIDINPGYVGLKSYNPFVVGFFITLNTYCAPINAFLYLMWHMFATQRNLLPVRQEKEQISDIQLFENTEEDLHLVYSLYTATTVMPVAVYWCLLVGFRYHLFIYSVFAPKAFYECFYLLVFYLNFILTNLYFRLFLK